MALVGGAGPAQPADEAVQAIADKVSFFFLLGAGKKIPPLLNHYSRLTDGCS